MNRQEKSQTLRATPCQREPVAALQRVGRGLARDLFWRPARKRSRPAVRRSLRRRLPGRRSHPDERVEEIVGRIAASVDAPVTWTSRAL